MIIWPPNPLKQSELSISSTPDKYPKEVKKGVMIIINQVLGQNSWKENISKKSGNSLIITSIGIMKIFPLYL